MILKNKGDFFFTLVFEEMIQIIDTTTNMERILENVTKIKQIIVSLIFKKRY
jgi:hypothetical protein